MVFGEMRKRGVGVDNAILGRLNLRALGEKESERGLQSSARGNESDISVYHGLMKGLLGPRKAGEATQVLREML